MADEAPGRPRLGSDQSGDSASIAYVWNRKKVNQEIRKAKSQRLLNARTQIPARLTLSDRVPFAVSFSMCFVFVVRLVSLTHQPRTPRPNINVLPRTKALLQKPFPRTSH